MSSNPPSFDPKVVRRRPVDDARKAANMDANGKPPRSNGAALPPTIPPTKGTPQRRSVIGDAAEPSRTRVEAHPTPVADHNPPPPTFAPRRTNAGGASTPASAPPGTSGRSDRKRILPSASGSTTPFAIKKPKHRKVWPLAVAALVVVVLVWPIFLVAYTNAHLQRVDALVAGASSPGTTYLIAGSDGREDGAIDDGVEGERADSILMVHVAPNGQSTMLSLPRDTYVEIPGEGWSKLNSAFSWGGPALLVETVQNLTGIAIDHYVQLNMGGVGMLVDAVGGVNLCMDMDVDDPYSGLKWTAGCKDVKGNEALAYARMRYEDPRGDLGRAERQREIISKVTKKALSVGTFINPVKQLRLSNAGTEALIIDEKMSLFDIGKLVLAFRNSTNKGFMGTPPIESLAVDTAAGTAVILDEERTPDFFQKLAQGTLTQDDFDAH